MIKRQHYYTKINKWRIFKQFPFTYVSRSGLACGFHNVACFENKDKYGQRGNESCVFANLKNRVKGALQILFF